MEKRGAVLDLGCGAGQNTAMLARYSRWAEGVDHDEKAIKFAMKHNTGSGAVFKWGSFPHCIKPSERFDYIFCIETMEHVHYGDQVKFLQSAIDLLSPEGRLFITTPNEEESSGHHIGIWSKKFRKEMLEFLGKRVAYHGFIDNQKPDAGFSDDPKSHLVLVIKR